MASQIEKTTMKYYDKRGDEHKVYPKTTAEQVIGLQDAISDLIAPTDVIDTYGIAGTAGTEKKPQNMFDAIGNFIHNSALTVSGFATNFTAKLKNNTTTEDEGYALDARQGKELQNNINTVSASVSDLNTSVTRRLSNIDNAISALEEDTKHITKTKIVLSKDNWANGRQTITVSGVKAEDEMCVFICPLTASMETYVTDNIICNSQSVNTLGFMCDIVPNVDVEIYVVMFE